MKAQVPICDARLVLHSPQGENDLSTHYQQAFGRAREIALVTAYLTDWNTKLRLNKSCARFRLITGKDFGITRKHACKEVLKWLPRRFKGQFLVADGIAGFHPKAVFWKEEGGRSFAIVGSSNLTNAAFVRNYEANVVSELSDAEYKRVKTWLSRIERNCETVSPTWLDEYAEAEFPKPSPSGQKHKVARSDTVRVLTIKLPAPPGSKKIISDRRHALNEFGKHRAGLVRLFRRCAKGTISSAEFYSRLPDFWSHELGDRLQGKGFTIKGKHSDFAVLSRSVCTILNADDVDRDDVVASQIDLLERMHVPTRRALLSEMLCLFFPDSYPVLNTPVIRFRSAVRLRKIRGASAGSDYIYLARTLRNAIRQNPDHLAKNLAEADAVIWLQYRNHG